MCFSGFLYALPLASTLGMMTFEQGFAPTMSSLIAYSNMEEMKDKWWRIVFCDNGFPFRLLAPGFARELMNFWMSRAVILSRRRCPSAGMTLSAMRCSRCKVVLRWLRFAYSVSHISTTFWNFTAAVTWPCAHSSSNSIAMRWTSLSACLADIFSGGFQLLNLTICFPCTS